MNPGARRTDDAPHTIDERKAAAALSTPGPGAELRDRPPRELADRRHHVLGGGAVAGIFDDPADGHPQCADGGVLAQPDARTGIYHPAGAVGLVAAHWHPDQ